MKTILRLGIIIVLFCLIAAPVQAQSALEKHEALATKLVNQCANIHEGDLVAITGGVRDADLMHELSIQTRKVGAFPIIALTANTMDGDREHCIESGMDDFININIQ